MRYLVSDASIGEAGRTVRCASCSQQWFQEGVKAQDVPPAPAPEKPAAVSDIPDSVKPRPEDAAPPVLASEAQAMRDQDLIARVCGFFAAFLVFLALFIAMIVFKGPITHYAPASVMLYELAGLAPPVPGEGVIIDQLSAQVSGETMDIKGRAINLTAKDVTLPSMAASVLNEAGDVLAQYPVDMEVDALKGETEAAFSLSLPAPAAQAVSVRVGFIGKPLETGAASAEPSAVHPE